jgi:alkylresorcinol/alkylpyrone synthase
MAELVSIATAVPAHDLDADETRRHLVSYLGDVGVARYGPMVEATRIRRRHTVAPVSDLLRLDGIQARNDLYAAHALTLGEDVARAALRDADVDPRTLTVVLSTSCTGYMMPSLDAHLIERIGLPATVRRVPITEMGCAAGVGTVALAGVLLGSSSAAALVVSVELSSLGLQLAEPSRADMMANLLFGDGAAGAVVAAKTAARGPEIMASHSTLWPGSLRLLGMRLTDTGFRLQLSRALPQLVARHLAPTMREFLGAYGLTLAEVSFWAVHPGGPRVLESVQAALGLSDAAVRPSWQVWEDHGNLSSATVFFILRHLGKHMPPRPGAYGVMLAFGPGVACEVVLLRAAGWLCGRG